MSYMKGWGLPGGGVDKNETFEASALRELKEECALEAQGAQLFGIYLNTHEGKIDHVAVYSVDHATKSSHVPNKNEIVESKFFDLNTLPNDIMPGHLRRIDEFMGIKPKSLTW